MPDRFELVQRPAEPQQQPEPARPRRKAAAGVAFPRRGVLAAAPGSGRIPSLAAVPVESYDDHEREAERLTDAVAGLLPGGLDIEGVRIHTGHDSERMAEMLDAEAVTVGADIHLGADHPPLTSVAGRRLIAHELVHVRQQASGRAPRGVPQRKPRKPRPPRSKPFRVAVNRTMGPEDLLRAFVAQYYRISDPHELERVVRLWHWTGRPRSATEVDKARGYVQVNVYDVVAAGLGALDKKDRDAINAETDRRFLAEAKLPPGTRLGTGPKDAELAARWRGVRANLLAEQEQARALNALPDDIKQILFAGGRQIQPDEYDDALALADRLGKLSKADRARYLATVNATTSDLAEMKKSIAGFEFRLRLRDLDAEATDEAAADIFGLEELYDLWKAKRLAEAIEAAGLGSEEDSEAANTRFRDALAHSHFKTEADFVAAIQTYLKRFRTEAVNLAMDVLAGYDHLLYVAKLKFRDTDAAAKLVGAIAASGAPAEYGAADAASVRASSASARIMAAARRDVGPDPRDVEEYSRAEAEVVARREAGSAKVVTASGGEPLIDPAVLGRKTNREKLTHLSADEARRYLLDIIDDRLKDTMQVREELIQDPERVFSQPPLLKATMQSQGIEGDTIYARIVDDHVQEIRDAHLFSAIVLGIIALVLAVLVPGGGWVAAAALVANAGISTWQAMEAIKEYKAELPEYALNFITQEPSLFWVGVAVVAAAFDLGMTASQLLKASAPALKQLETPLREFSTAADLETKAAQLEKLTAKIDAAGLEKELADSIKAYAKAELGLTQALGKTAKLRGVFGAVDATPVFEALYYAVRKGTVKIGALRKEKELIAAFGELAAAEGAAGEGITVVFKRVRKIVDLGRGKGMDDATMLKYVDRLAAERAGGEGAFEVLAEEMKAWRRPTAEQVAAEAGLAEAHGQLLSLHKYQADLEAELAARRAGQIPGDADRMTEIEAELEWLTGKTSKGRKIRPGAVAEARKAFEDAMRLAEQAKLDPKVLMRRAFAVSDERQAVLDAAKGVDQVGALLTKPSGIHPDHIVSMQRMTRMDGFEKLTLKERQLLAVRSDNLIAMDAAANLSKGERGWNAWRQASFFYSAETIEKMAKEEARLFETIQRWITETTAGR